MAEYQVNTDPEFPGSLLVEDVVTGEVMYQLPQECQELAQALADRLNEEAAEAAWDRQAERDLEDPPAPFRGPQTVEEYRIAKGRV